MSQVKVIGYNNVIGLNFAFVVQYFDRKTAFVMSGRAVAMSMLR